MGQGVGTTQLAPGLWGNYTTANRQLLDIDDFLGNRANRVLLAIDGPLQRPSDIR